jgi:hypothetical protein
VAGVLVRMSSAGAWSGGGGLLRSNESVTTAVVGLTMQAVKAVLALDFRQLQTEAEGNLALTLGRRLQQRGADEDSAARRQSLRESLRPQLKKLWSLLRPYGHVHVNGMVSLSLGAPECCAARYQSKRLDDPKDQHAAVLVRKALKIVVDLVLWTELADAEPLSALAFLLYAQQLSLGLSGGHSVNYELFARMARALESRCCGWLARDGSFGDVVSPRFFLFAPTDQWLVPNLSRACSHPVRLSPLTIAARPLGLTAEHIVLALRVAIARDEFEEHDIAGAKRLKHTLSLVENLGDNGMLELAASDLEDEPAQSSRPEYNFAPASDPTTPGSGGSQAAAFPALLDARLGGLLSGAYGHVGAQPPPPPVPPVPPCLGVPSPYYGGEPLVMLRTPLGAPKAPEPPPRPLLPPPVPLPVLAAATARAPAPASVAPPQLTAPQQASGVRRIVQVIRPGDAAVAPAPPPPRRHRPSWPDPEASSVKAFIESFFGDAAAPPPWTHLSPLFAGAAAPTVITDLRDLLVQATLATPTQALPFEEDDSECSVCFEKMCDPGGLLQLHECKHIFHAACIANWHSYRTPAPHDGALAAGSAGKRCPMCNGEFNLALAYLPDSAPASATLDEPLESRMAALHLAPVARRVVA